MAITAPMKLSDFSGFIPPNEAAPIFDDAQYMSAAQSLFRRIPLGASGEAIPVITSKPTANWVEEGEKKPATNMGFDKINVVPKTLAAIAVMSSKVVRANPANVTQQIRRGLSEAFARAFDYAVFHDLGGDGTGTGPFDVSLSQATKSVTVGTATQAKGGIHGDTVAALDLMVKDSKRLTDWALDDVLEPRFWGAVDATGRPLYVDLPFKEQAEVLAQDGLSVSRPGRLLNRQSAMADGVGNGTIQGFFGDFTKGAWGAVGGISYRISTEATVTINGELVSLFENNLVAVLAEAEYGFAVQSADYFGKLVTAP